MGRSHLFRDVARVFRAARYCDANRLPSREGLERLASHGVSRRRFLAAAGAATIAASRAGTLAAAVCDGGRISGESRRQGPITLIPLPQGPVHRAYRPGARR